MFLCSGQYAFHQDRLGLPLECLFCSWRAHELVTQWALPSPPLPPIAGAQELTSRYVCAHWLSCLSSAKSQTRPRSSFPPRMETESCCCRPSWSCWNGWAVGGAGWSWMNPSWTGCPAGGSLWRRSSFHLWCWPHWRDRASPDPRTRWPGRCRRSSHSCSCCRWRSDDHDGRWGNSEQLKTRSKVPDCCRLNYLKTQQSPCQEEFQLPGSLHQEVRQQSANLSGECLHRNDLEFTPYSNFTR